MYTSNQVDEIEQFVRVSGHGLLVMSDIPTYENLLDNVSSRFSIDLGEGTSDGPVSNSNEPFFSGVTSIKFFSEGGILQVSCAFVRIRAGGIRPGRQQEGPMAGEQNIEQAKRGYAAFDSGDVQTAMADIADDVEWIVPGESAISGTYNGKEEVLGLFGKLAEKGFSQREQHWFSDDERVVLLKEVTIDGQQSDAVDVLTYRDGKLVKYEGAGDTALQERIWGRK